MQDIPFDGEQAYDYLKQICDLGPRPSGSAAMTRQRTLLQTHFEKLGAKVTVQSLRVRHPLNGAAVEMANLIVEWQPEAKERILIGVHYDTRPYPDRDPRNPKGRFIGANDGASGVALLMQLGTAMADVQRKAGRRLRLFRRRGVDLRRPRRVLSGLDLFRRTIRRHSRRRTNIEWERCLDMVADKDLQIL